MARMSDERAFELIGLPPSATEREVQRSYRTLALTRHPDRGGSAEAMAELNEAHEVALEAVRERDERLEKYVASMPEGEVQVGEDFCPTCGGAKKVKVTRGWSQVEVACPTCAVEG